MTAADRSGALRAGQPWVAVRSRGRIALGPGVFEGGAAADPLGVPGGGDHLGSSAHRGGPRLGYAQPGPAMPEYLKEGPAFGAPWGARRLVDHEVLRFSHALGRGRRFVLSSDTPRAVGCLRILLGLFLLWSSVRFELLLP